MGQQIASKSPVKRAPRRQRQNYVDNKVLYAAMTDYINSVEKAEEDGTELPRVTAYIGDCIMKISEHLSYSPNFMNYSFREEMVNDGIENCLQYINNFDPKKYNNPFSYFTQIIFYAFLRRIAKEKKYLYTKHVATARANLLHETSTSQAGDGAHGDKIKFGEYSQEQMEKFIEDFETKKAAKKQKRNKV